jgi:hypothetical protein
LPAVVLELPAALSEVPVIAPIISRFPLELPAAMLELPEASTVVLATTSKSSHAPLELPADALESPSIVESSHRRKDKKKQRKKDKRLKKTAVKDASAIDEPPSHGLLVAADFDVLLSPTVTEIISTIALKLPAEESPGTQPAADARVQALASVAVDYEIMANFEHLIRSHGFGPASNMQSRWRPVPWKEAIQSIHMACKHVAKDFSERVVLEMAQDYVKYNFLSVIELPRHPSSSSLEQPSEQLCSAKGRAFALLAQ